MWRSKVDTGSDHRFVRAKVQINKKMERIRRMKRHTDLGKLSDKQYQFQLELKNRFSLLEDMIENEPVDVMCEQVTSIIIEEVEKLAKGQKEKINTTSVYTE